MAPPTRLATAALSLITAGAVGACGSSSSSSRSTAATALPAAACRVVNPADQAVTTRADVFLLHMGSPENMLMITPAQARSKHITAGEVMIGGSMDAMPSGLMHGRMTTRHLEVHICARATGKVLAGAMPAITLTPSKSGKPLQIPVAVMQGVTAGPGDLHYGNNVPLRSGASYRVTVRLGAERATFNYTVPRGM